MVARITEEDLLPDVPPAVEAILADAGMTEGAKGEGGTERRGKVQTDARRIYRRSRSLPRLYGPEPVPFLGGS